MHVIHAAAALVQSTAAILEVIVQIVGALVGALVGWF
jgi:hypothetical protein